MGCRHGFVKRWVTRHKQLGHVRDSPRSGRPHKASVAAVQHVLMAAQLPECTSAADIAARTKQDVEVQLSRSSVTRILKRKGMQHLSPKVVPLLTAMQKAARIKFARAALRTEVESWRRCMLWASLLADGAHQLAEVQLPDPRQALLSMPTWAAVAMAPPHSSL
ncbi:TPA: hypothetical protein ACH3X1_004887 [Trebouxia sp. C0004]